MCRWRGWQVSTAKISLALFERSPIMKKTSLWLVVAMMVSVSVAHADILNGSFEDGLNPWVLYPSLPGSTTIGVVSSAEVLPLPSPDFRWQSTAGDLMLYMTARSAVPIPYTT